MSVEINPPFRVFTDVDGEPLEDGYIHIGAVNQNPQAVPISVFWDQALTIPAAQPIRTLGGYPSRTGTPSRMYIAETEYSISVSNKNGTLIYSDLNDQAGDVSVRLEMLGLLLPRPVVIAGIVDLQSADVTDALNYSVIGFYSGSTIGGGDFYWSATEPKASHDGWKIIDPDISWDGTAATLPAYLSGAGGAGVGCFIRVFDGTASPEMAGAVTDWNGTTGTVAKSSFDALLEDASVIKIVGSGRPYWFGSIAQNQALFTITRDIVIDWGGSLLVCSSDNAVSGTSAALFKFNDCRLNMGNYIFDDIAFLIGGVSRGAMPVLLNAGSAVITGHSLGPFHVIKGQSMLTAASDAPLTARSKGIKLVGGCTGDTVYYGVNLANNGDDFVGEYTIKTTVNRALFVYGVDGVNAVFSAPTTEAASASVFVSNSGTGFPETKNVKVVAKIGTINGPCVLADQSSANGTGIYRNIDVDFSYTTLGSNLTVSDSIVRIGAFDVGGNYYTVEKTIITDNIKIAIRPASSAALLDTPIKVFTPSPNYGLLSIVDGTPYEVSALYPKNASNVPQGPTCLVNGRFIKAAHGDLTAAGNVAIIPTKFIASRDKNYEVIAELRVTLRNNVGGSNEYAYKVISIIGTLSSTGVLTLHNATELESNINGGLTPVVTVTAVASGLQVSSTVYTGAFANLVASVSWA